MKRFIGSDTDYIRSSSIPEPNTGCWFWLWQLNNGGYGIVGLRRHRKMLAHRLSYESFVGPIPPALDIDHLCRTRSCVNPEHLQPVTRSENLRRGLGPRLTSLRHKGVRITHCHRGHEYSTENTYWHGDYRRCRTCAALRASWKRAKS